MLIMCLDARVSNHDIENYTANSCTILRHKDHEQIYIKDKRVESQLLIFMDKSILYAKIALKKSLIVSQLSTNYKTIFSYF